MYITFQMFHYMELIGCLILCFSNFKKELMEEYHEEQSDNLIDYQIPQN